MARIPVATPQAGIRQVSLQGTGQQFRGGVADTSAIGRGLQAVGEGIGAVNVAIDRKQNQQEDFLAKRRFIEFQTSQTQRLREMERDAEPGAFGLTQSAQEEYQKAANEFARTLPERLRGEYDVRLADAESSVVLRADTFQQKARTEFYTNSINDGLTSLRDQVIEGELSYEEAVEQGQSLIASSDIPAIDRDNFIRSWDRDAAAALWRQEFNQDPDGAIAAAGGGTPAQRIAYQTNRLVGAVIQAESGGNPDAVSPVGAAGIMQVMPGTAKDIAREIKDPDFPSDGTDEEIRTFLKNPENGKRYGEYYLQKQIDAFDGDVEAALIAYNAGPGNARKWLNAGRDYSALPKRSETEPYVQKIMGNLGAQTTPQGGEPYRVSETGPADPRFDVLDLNTRQQLIADAQGRINDLNKAQRNSVMDSFELRFEQSPGSVTEDEILGAPGLDEGDKAKLLAKRDSALASSASERVGQIELDLVQSPRSVTEEAILDETGLSDSQKATLLKKRKDAIKEYDDTQNAVSLYAQGVQGNALSTDDRKSVDAVWKDIAPQPTDENYAISALSVVRQRGILPGPVLEGIRGTILQGDVEGTANMLDLASAASDLNNQSLAGRGGSTDVRNAVAEYNHFLKLGFSKDAAAQKVIQARDPNRVETAIPKEVQKKVDAISASDVENIYDESFTDLFTSDPTLGPAVSEQRLVGEYREIFSEHYQQTGDVETARARADAQMKRTYNVSEATGKPVIMRYPPEAYYPAFEGSRDYVKTQLQESVASAFGEEVESYDLVPVPGVTDVDARMGRPPRYGVIVEKPDGTLDVLPDGVFFQADVEAGQQAEAVNRQDQIKSRYQELQDAALDNEGLVVNQDELLVRVRPDTGQQDFSGDISPVVVNTKTREIYKRNPQTEEFEPTGDRYKTPVLIQMDGRPFSFVREPEFRQDVQERRDVRARQHAEDRTEYLRRRAREGN